MALTLVPEEIEAYAARHTTPLDAVLSELEQRTHAEMGEQAGMLSGQVEGMLLRMLVQAVGAKRVLEIGTFTGLSALMMAAGLPADGRLITCDVDPKATAIACSFFERHPDGKKIELRIGPALETIAQLEGPFGFIFIDADKENYVNYYEAVLPLLAPNGFIAVDNVLWSGRVLAPKEESDRAIVAFNEHVRSDSRVTHALVTVRDGLMLIRRADGSSAS